MNGGPTSTESGSLGLYVHWPFCRSKCPYCDFNSHVRESIDQPRWRAALLRELAHYAGLTGPRTLTSIFFGGGTPSLMAPETVSTVIGAATRLWNLAPDIEITLEANPTSSEATRFEGYAAAGVNRLSLGVQSLEDAALRFLGREHSAAEALEAVALAQRCFPRVSFDLIYARPGQDLNEWRTELERALAQQPSHISLYQLTIEEGTAFHARRRRRELIELPEDRALDMFERTRDWLAAAGLPAYEISNHARPGEACRHNLTYWRYCDYVGIGPGAHGRLAYGGQKYATRQHRAPEAWLSTVETKGHATRQFDALSRDQILTELLLMGLRLDEGIPLQRLHDEMRVKPETLFGDGLLRMLSDEGYLDPAPDTLRLTQRGFACLDAVVRLLLQPSKQAVLS